MFTIRSYNNGENICFLKASIRRRRRTFIYTKYIRQETLAKVYKNHSLEGSPCNQYKIIIIMYMYIFFVTYRYPAVTIRRPHADPTPGHGRRRWTNIGSTQGQLIVPAGYSFWSCTIENTQIDIRRSTKHINIFITRQV